MSFVVIVLLGCCHTPLISINSKKKIHCALIGVGIKILKIGNWQNEEAFPPTVFFIVLLPPIIFESGYNLHKGNFFQNIGSILLFAIFGTVISALIVGGGLYLLGKAGLVYEFDIVESFAFGSLISAVDPVATLAIFKALNVDQILYMLVFGESVLNDAVAIVLTTTILEYNKPDVVITSGASAFFGAVGRFCVMFFASSAIGVLLGLISALLLKHFDLRKTPSLEFGLMLTFSYLPYGLAEGLHLSGIMAILFCGIVMSHYTHSNLSPVTQITTQMTFRTISFIAGKQITTQMTFRTISFIAETCVFAYLGLAIFSFNGLIVKPALVIWGIALVLIGRAFNIFPLTFLANFFREHKITRKNQFIMWFSDHIKEIKRFNILKEFKGHKFGVLEKESEPYINVTSFLRYIFNHCDQLQICSEIVLQIQSKLTQKRDEFCLQNTQDLYKDVVYNEISIDEDKISSLHKQYKYNFTKDEWIKICLFETHFLLEFEEAEYAEFEEQLAAKYIFLQNIEAVKEITKSINRTSKRTIKSRQKRQNTASENEEIQIYSEKVHIVKKVEFELTDLFENEIEKVIVSNCINKCKHEFSCHVFAELKNEHCLNNEELIQTIQLHLNRKHDLKCGLIILLQPDTFASFLADNGKIARFRFLEEFQQTGLPERIIFTTTHQKSPYNFGLDTQRELDHKDVLKSFRSGATMSSVVPRMALIDSLNEAHDASNSTKSFNEAKDEKSSDHKRNNLLGLSLNQTDINYILRIARLILIYRMPYQQMRTLKL
ncbi:SLC9A8 [Mytilus coruscus]|uniref:Sodium/hydrogen exchanger n=1 Tax=Mytilus coruscus TaxID=42192 RepID=A0A6J8EQY7_MYTCO|nr:SLC9A8 [Mytilus coruscus]